MIAPGSTIGILGGGQLGRMLILAGRALGYRFHVFDPSAEAPASGLADKSYTADYCDQAALSQFADAVDVITLEFENIPIEAIDFLSQRKPVHPNRQTLYTCQHRQREKDFLKQHGFPCVRFEYADDPASLQVAIAQVGYPCVIKTAAFGYDGKGQVKLGSPSDVSDSEALWQQLGKPPRVVVEQWIEHQGEFSVICARNAQGQCSTLPVAENVHRNHILHSSLAPARLSSAQKASVEAISMALADQLAVIGLLAVEFFLAPDGSWLINEMAPRPHNSGHFSLDSCVSSQFEQHIRAITGLPFGSSQPHHACVMINLLGDVWANGRPDWSALLADPQVKLHLYGKSSARSGRKMGHFCLLADAPETALQQAEQLYQNLLSATPSD